MSAFAGLPQGSEPSTSSERCARRQSVARAKMLAWPQMPRGTISTWYYQAPCKATNKSVTTFLHRRPSLLVSSAHDPGQFSSSIKLSPQEVTSNSQICMSRLSTP